MPSMEKPMPSVSDADLALIKITFTGNEPLLKAMRALFFGLPVTQDYKNIIKTTFVNPELMALMRRKLLAPMDADAPIGQISDTWLGVENMVFAQNPDTIYQAVRYKELAIAMTEKALALLADPSGEPIDTKFVVPTGPMVDRDIALQVSLLARNQYIRNIEQQLLFLWLLAQQEKTPEQIAAVGAKNSGK